MNHKKELLRGLWVGARESRLVADKQQQESVSPVRDAGTIRAVVALRVVVVFDKSTIAEGERRAM